MGDDWKGDARQACKHPGVEEELKHPCMLQRVASRCGCCGHESGRENGIHRFSADVRAELRVSGNTDCGSIPDRQNAPAESNPVWDGSTGRPMGGDQKNRRCGRSAFRCTF
jgi:hypothetical protein